MKIIITSIILLMIPFIGALAQQGMGVGNNNPQEMLDVTGAVKIGTDSNNNTGAPAGGEGTIRYKAGQYEGWDGTSWQPLGGSGLLGPTGATGPAGVAGTNGTNGLVGATGAAGNDGAAGATGAQGPIGLTGATGSVGATGATGPQGSAGANGLDGAPGATGLQGPAGANGLDGPTGATGPAGADGQGGVTTAGTNVTITGAGTGLDPYVVNANGGTPTYTIGLWPELGGYVFWVSADGKHGLVAETQDQGPFSWYEAQNLISNPSTHSVNGQKFRDWRMPTKFELNEMYLQQGAIGGFDDGGYWSSTELDSLVAGVQLFGNGGQFNFNKANFNGDVRAVRAF